MKTKLDAELGISKSVGFGWVGRRPDGRLGLMLPETLGFSKGISDIPPEDKLRNDPDAEVCLCKITVELVQGENSPSSLKARDLLIGSER